MDNSMSTVTRESVLDVLNTLESMTMVSWNASTSGFKSTDRYGGRGSSSRVSGTSSPDEKEEDNSSIVSSEDSDDEDAAAVHRASVATFSNLKHLNESELNSMVHLSFTETETICLIDIPSTSISTEFVEESTKVKAANAAYKELKSIRNNNDNYVERGMQTFNNSSKNKESQAFAILRNSVECQANIWSIFDSVVASEKRTDGKDANSSAESESHVPGYSSTDQPSDAQVSTQTDPMDTMMAPLEEEKEESESSSSVILGAPTAPSSAPAEKARMDSLLTLNQDNLKWSLSIMESAVLGNNHMPKFFAYRDIVSVEEMVTRQESQEWGKEPEKQTYESNIPLLELLWAYRCELTKGRSVTYMAWNKQTEDILAVAYSDCNKLSNSNTFPGLILCWSVKNPEWPQRIYKTQSPVTSLDFSKNNSNLLACGFMDGRIAIYDVRKSDNLPVLDNAEISGKHRDPIWEVKWIDRVVGDDQSKGEALVSVSTDGRVTQWLIKKGLEYADLMCLKRVIKQQEIKPQSGTGQNVSSQSSSTSKSASFIARQSGGLCFDFNPKDSNIYLVGTEDGQIHKCSCSYNEQYLQTYFAHSGPIYRIRWSPFLYNAFLSCSSDWTVRLWNSDSEEPVFKFQSGKDSVADVAWSTNSSTVFGCVGTDGRMEIWDLQFSVLDPLIVHTVLDRQLTSILFSSKAPNVLVGDDSGSVNVYKIRKFNFNSKTTPEEQISNLTSIMIPKQENTGQVPTNEG